MTCDIMKKLHHLFMFFLTSVAISPLTAIGESEPAPAPHISNDALLLNGAIIFGGLTFAAVIIEYLKESELSLDELFTRREMPSFWKYVLSTYTLGLKGDRVSLRNYFHNHQLFLLFASISAACGTARLVSFAADYRKNHLQSGK